MLLGLHSQVGNYSCYFVTSFSPCGMTRWASFPQNLKFLGCPWPKSLSSSLSKLLPQKPENPTWTWFYFFLNGLSLGSSPLGQCGTVPADILPKLLIYRTQKYFKIQKMSDVRVHSWIDCECNEQSCHSPSIVIYILDFESKWFFNL